MLRAMELIKVTSRSLQQLDRDVYGRGGPGVAMGVSAYRVPLSNQWWVRRHAEAAQSQTILASSSF